jgi:hypothetical protein
MAIYNKAILIKDADHGIIIIISSAFHIIVAFLMYLDSKPLAKLLGQWYLTFAIPDDSTSLHNSATTV